MKFLWEILVPVADNNGKIFPVKHHRAWDARVNKISGELTISKPTKGYWTFEGKVYKEKMIPVSIICTRKQIVRIADFTADYYAQKAIMLYQLGKFKIRHYKGT